MLGAHGESLVRLFRIFQSPTAVAATIHLLATLATASAKGAKRRFADRDRISAELGIYLDETESDPE